MFLVLKSIATFALWLWSDQRYWFRFLCTLNQKPNRQSLMMLHVIRLLSFIAFIRANGKIGVSIQNEPIK